MARRRSTHRRRRGRFNWILKLIFLLLAVGALIAAMTIFFRVESIEVEGESRYADADIVAASGVKIEDNLFLMDKFTVQSAITTQLPYIETAELNRKLPHTIVLNVTEADCAARIDSGGESWLVSRKGKLLEKGAAAPAGCCTVTGAALAAPELSGEVSFGEEQSFKKTALLELLQQAKAMGVAADILSVDLSDDTALHFAFLGRFEVKLPWDADIAYKLKSLIATVDYLEDNETGEINLLVDGQARFIPYA